MRDHEGDRRRESQTAIALVTRCVQGLMKQAEGDCERDDHRSSLPGIGGHSGAGRSPRTTRATPITMTAIPQRSTAVTGSARSTAPVSTATTGLT